MHPNAFLYEKIKTVNHLRKSNGLTKVMYREYKIAPPNFYHASLIICESNDSYVSEIGKGFDLTIQSSEVNYMELPNINIKIKDVKQLEQQFENDAYILGFNDCRHHCNKMMDVIYEVNDEP